MKALTRKIGYVKPTSTENVVPVKKVEREEFEPKVKNDVLKEEPNIDLAAIVEVSKLKTKKIVNWINGHKGFKWGVMCTELKMDRGNFQRTLKSKEPNIRIEFIPKIEEFLKEYGY